MTHVPTPGGRDGAAPSPDLPAGLAAELRALRRDVAPGRELWPAIAALLETPAMATAPAMAMTGPPAAPRPAPRRDWRRHFRRRNAGYAAAAAVVLAVAVGWQLLLVRAPAGPADDPARMLATRGTPAADVPLLRAADALAREYQGALREVQAASASASATDPTRAGGPTAALGLDAELERSAAEVRAALARDPEALHLFRQLQRIYAHRLALELRQA